MKNTALALALAGFMLHVGAPPALAQIGGLLGKAQKARETVDKVDDLVISDADERRLGEGISAALIDRFGVYQDAAVAKYVSLVGNVLAQASTRPNLKWEFIVLDTDGVNAYAAPGGLVHITRGALGLIKNESELAGVLGHEITHITVKHTVRAIQKAKGTGLGAGVAGDKAGGWSGRALDFGINKGYAVVFENQFDRREEMEADKVGTALANSVGYAPNGMISVLARIADRNKSQKEPNGWFASHPQLKDRIGTMDKQIKNGKLNATALAAPRYTAAISFDVKPAAVIAMIEPGARGMAGAEPARGEKADAKEEEKKPKKGGVFGGGFLSKGSQAQNTGTVASAGTRGGVPDRDAVGGSNKSKMRITLSPAEIATFKKGIA